MNGSNQINSEQNFENNDSHIFFYRISLSLKAQVKYCVFWRMTQHQTNVTKVTNVINVKKVQNGINGKRNQWRQNQKSKQLLISKMYILYCLGQFKKIPAKAKRFQLNPKQSKKNPKSTLTTQKKNIYSTPLPPEESKSQKHPAFLVPKN